MIQKETVLKVTDNSGAKLVKCIKILGGSNKKTAKIGDIILVSTKKLKDNNKKKALKLKKKEIFEALIVQTKNLKKTNGFFFKVNKNSVVLLDKQKNPIGTRINGFLPKELRYKFIKCVSLCSFVV